MKRHKKTLIILVTAICAVLLLASLCLAAATVYSAYRTIAEAGELSVAGAAALFIERLFSLHLSMKEIAFLVLAAVSIVALVLLFIVMRKALRESE